MHNEPNSLYDELPQRDGKRSVGIRCNGKVLYDKQTYYGMNKCVPLQSPARYFQRR